MLESPLTAKSERLEMRVSPETKAIIQRACQLAGVSVSGFATMVLLREAVNLLQTYEQVLTFSARDTLALVAALEQPPEPNAALRQAWDEFHTP